MADTAGIAIKVVILVVLLGVLGVSIAILVTVLNNKDKWSSNSSVPDATVTSTIAPSDIDTGIPAAPIVNANERRFANYKQVSDNLEKWMDTTVSPCDDFYAYTCKKGQVNKVLGPFAVSENYDIQTQIDAYKDDSYFASAAKPLKQLKHFYDKCVTPDATQADLKAWLKGKVEGLTTEIGVNFPMLYQTQSVTSLSADNLANLLGFPIKEVGAGSLVRVSVLQDWETPDEVPARVYIDQTFPMFVEEVYTNWAQYRTVVVKAIAGDISQIAGNIGVTLNQAQLNRDAAAVADMEYALRDYITDDNTRRQSQRSYNKQTIAQLQTASPAYNWINLIKAALTRANAPEKVVNTLEVIVKEPDMIAKLSRDILANKFVPSTIANYAYYRAVTGLSLPPTTLQVEESRAHSEKDSALLRRPKERAMGGPRLRKEPDLDELIKHLGAAIKPKELGCFKAVLDKMPRAADRIFVDKIYTTDQSRTDVHSQVLGVANWIFSGFRSQIDMLNWMSDESKKGAYGKLDNIQLNIAYPDWVTNDTALAAYYTGLGIEDASNTIQVYDAINAFVLTQQVQNFRLNQPRDRGDFITAVGTTNAFYNPSSNSIIYPAGILHAPFYDTNYPAAVNFGGLGTVSGHELTHGFDDEGVQWDGLGVLNTWMDGPTETSFRAMADCVVNEYSALCPLTGGQQPCLNGQNTQGENIADNGGIQAAYKAFKAYEAYNGPDPRLPAFGSKFTNDQLFFLSFASVWCDAAETDAEYKDQIATDPHSPAKYRVFGTLQNFPAFRTAFNCPVGAKYAPSQHCDVWTSPPFN